VAVEADLGDQHADGLCGSHGRQFYRVAPPPGGPAPSRAAVSRSVSPGRGGSGPIRAPPRRWRSPRSAAWSRGARATRTAHQAPGSVKMRPRPSPNTACPTSWSADCKTFPCQPKTRATPGVRQAAATAARPLLPQAEPGRARDSASGILWARRRDGSGGWLLARGAESRMTGEGERTRPPDGLKRRRR
jgi:hypothetical protein